MKNPTPALKNPTPALKNPTPALKNPTPAFLGSVIIGLLVWDIATHSGRAQEADTVPASVTAREFRLVNGQGKTTALLFNGKDGATSLSLIDGGGRPRAVVSVDTTGSGVDLLDPKGKIVADMESTTDLSGVNKSLVAVGGREGEMAELINDGGSVGLTVTDAGMKKCAALSYADNLQGALLVVGDSKHKGGFTVLNVEGVCQMSMQNSTGKVGWQKRL